MYDTNKLFFNTEPINQEKAKKAVLDLYEYCYKKSLTSVLWQSYIDNGPVNFPEIVFVDGPTELAEKVKITNWTSLERFNDIAHFVTKRGSGSKERVSGVVTSVLRRAVNHKKKKRSWDCPLLIAVDYLYVDKEDSHRSKYENKWEELATALWDQAYACFTFCDTCYVVNRPSLAKFKEGRGLHCSDGPALVFRDGTEVYCHEGIEFTKDNVLCPNKMTLEDIHSHGSYKHIAIDLCGVDNYLEMCKAWKPDVKGAFSRFFSFPKMVPVPGSWDLREYGKDWKGYGHMHVDKPYSLKIRHQDVNDEYCLKMEDDYNVFAFPAWQNPTDYPWSEKIFKKEDQKLWDSLAIEDMMLRGPLQIEVNFQNGIFSVESGKMYDHFPPCRRDVAPAWFKAKMFRKQDAYYERDKYAIKYENDKLLYAGNIMQARCMTKEMADDKEHIYVRDSLFGGMEQLPHYEFDLDIRSDSWEGLLEKWEQLAFEWLAME